MTATTTTTIPADLLALAKTLVEAEDVANVAYANLDFARKTATKTPTGRFTKASQKVIDIAEAARQIADKAEVAANEPFMEALYDFDVKTYSVERRKNNLLTIHNILFGTNDAIDVTPLYHARYESAVAGKTNVRPNPYGIETLVFDITPYGVGEGKPFRNVKTYASCRWNKEDPEFVENDWHVHLKVYFNEAGYFTGAYIHYGHHIEQDKERPRDQVLSHYHSVDIDRDPRDLSISTFSGSSSELRVWSAILGIVADLTETLAPLRKANNRSERPTPADRARALLEGKVI